ncbi:putative alkaline/neutral invertase B [Bienertia sinuspersici]
MHNCSRFCNFFEGFYKRLCSKVHHNAVKNGETLVTDFGEAAIGSVALVDSGFWWIILLHAYTKSSRDSSLADRPECQRRIHLIMSISL